MTVHARTPDELRATLADVERRIGKLEIERATAPRYQPWALFVRAREMGRLDGQARRLRYLLRKQETGGKRV